MLELTSMSSRVASICVCTAPCLNRRDHHIGGQRGVGRDHLEAHRLFLRLQRLHRAAVQAEDIGHIGNADLRREQVVLKGVVSWARARAVPAACWRLAEKPAVTLG